jgi:hypothetical protein
MSLVSSSNTFSSPVPPKYDTNPPQQTLEKQQIISGGNQSNHTISSKTLHVLRSKVTFYIFQRNEPSLRERYTVLTGVATNITVFWDVYRRFEHPLEGGSTSTESSLKINQTTRRHIPEECIPCILHHFQLHCCKAQGRRGS